MQGRLGRAHKARSQWRQVLVCARPVQVQADCRLSGQRRGDQQFVGARWARVEHRRRDFGTPTKLLVLLLVSAQANLFGRDDLAILDKLAALALALAILAMALVSLDWGALAMVAAA